MFFHHKKYLFLKLPSKWRENTINVKRVEEVLNKTSIWDAILWLFAIKDEEIRTLLVSSHLSHKMF